MGRKCSKLADAADGRQLGELSEQLLLVGGSLNLLTKFLYATVSESRPGVRPSSGRLALIRNVIMSCTGWLTIQTRMSLLTSADISAQSS